MENSEEKLRMKLIKYLAEMLHALGVSLETTKGILRFLHKDVGKMMAMMDWLGEHMDEDLTESQILYAMGDLINPK